MSPPSAAAPGKVAISDAGQKREAGAIIEGVVRGPEGNPVEGALVTLVPIRKRQGVGEWPSTRSQPGGRFRLDNVPVGRYAATATVPGLAGAYHEPFDVTAGITLRDVDLKAGGNKLTIHGWVADAKGRMVSGASIRADRVSPHYGDSFLTQSNDLGAYALDLPRAPYRVKAEAPGQESAFKGVEESAEAALNLNLTRSIPLDAPVPKEAVDWFREHAIPLTSTEAGHGFADMQAMRSVVGGAHLVSLGEATHGTREFFQLKHRILEFLVTEMGFSVFGIEASYPESLDVNDYILTGRGNPADALAGLRFWTWDTEEVLDQIRWMRAYNQDQTHPLKLKFYGFDMQFPSVGAQFVVHYLRKVDPDFARQAEQTLAPLDTDFDALNYDRLPLETRQATFEGVASILKRLEEDKEKYIGRSSPAEWMIAQQHARVVSQGERSGRENRFLVRDRAMAENVKALLDQQGEGTKMVLWAHNMHVALEGDELKPMGAYLKEMFGSEQIAFGFVFDRGSFHAMELPFSAGKGLKVFNVGAAPPGSLNAVLARVGRPVFVVDLRRAPSDGPVADWFDSSVRAHSIGSGYAYARAENFFAPQVTRKKFDALIFVEESSAARAMPSGRREATPPQPKLAELSNLDLETGIAGGTPAGWWAPPQPRKGGYTTALTEDRPLKGKRCALIRRDRAPWKWGFGKLSQKVDATAFRAKRVRLRAAVRADVVGLGNKAELFLQVDPAPQEDNLPRSLSFVSMFDHPIRSKKWRYYELQGEVPKDADSITVGLVLSGNGRAWLDDVSFEVVGEGNRLTGSHL